MGLPRGAYRSQQSMWPVNDSAHANTIASPRSRLNPSFTHSRYMPATPIITASQTTHVVFLRNSRKLTTGTNSMYMAVMNPALPAVVVTRPICCVMLPRARNTPQPMPPATLAFRLRALSAGGSLLPRQVSSATSPTTAVDSAIRAAAKVMGSLVSMPFRCATKAMPHTKEQAIR